MPSGVSIPESDPVTPPTLAPSPPRVPQTWKFLGTSLWGILVFAAMFAGQLSVLAYFLITDRAPFSFDEVKELAGGGLTISLSVIMGLPAALLALWIAIRLSGVSFADYLALRWTSWRYLLLGIVAMVVLVIGWEGISNAVGHESSAAFMVDVAKSARADGALWLLVISFCVVAPVSEELLTRGFLYRGWSESVLRPTGAILLSSMVWTAMHLQYDWFFFGQIFSIGLLFGYLRYFSGSIWPTVILHGLNNLAATLQTLWLANQP